MNRIQQLVSGTTMFAAAFLLMSSIAQAQSSKQGLGTQGKAPVGEIFKRLDTNSDGKLTKDELPQQAAGMMRADANGDGAVTKEELEKARKRFDSGQRGTGQRGTGQRPDGKGPDGKRAGGEGRGMAPNQEMIARIMQQFDKDGDKKLDAKELTALLTQMQNSRAQGTGRNAKTRPDPKGASGGLNRGGDKTGEVGGDRPRRPGSK